MKKIPTIFRREFIDRNTVKIYPEVIEGYEDVLKYGTATVKWDGSCCAVINGRFYKRYDAKNGKPVPEGAIKCQENPDPVTGHLPCWVEVDEDNPADKWFVEAYNNSFYTIESRFITDYNGISGQLIDGTYEAVGEHFNGNPYRYRNDRLIPHGIDEIYVPRNFEDIKYYLEHHNIEGIVFWYDGEPKAKIKRSDFGFEWNSKRGGGK